MNRSLTEVHLPNNMSGGEKYIFLQFKKKNALELQLKQLKLLKGNYYFLC